MVNAVVEVELWALDIRVVRFQNVALRSSTRRSLDKLCVFSTKYRGTSDGA